MIYKESKSQHNEEAGYHRKVNQNLEETIKKYSDQERAELFYQIYQEADMNEIKQEILAEGIDLNYIAYKSIMNNREDLLDYVIDKEIDFNMEVVGSISLLLHALNINSPFLDKIVNNTNDFDNSLILLMVKDDEELLDKLLAIKPDLSSNFINYLNLLHESIFYKSLNIFHKLLIEYPELANQKTLNDISSFHLALESKEDWFVQEIGKYINIKEEISNIIHSLKIENKEELLEKTLSFFSEKIEPSLIYDAFSSEEFELGGMLIDNYTGDDKNKLFRGMPGVSLLNDKEEVISILSCLGVEVSEDATEEYVMNKFAECLDYDGT